jgi:hypothetical protein
VFIKEISSSTPHEVRLIIAKEWIAGGATILAGKAVEYFSKNLYICLIGNCLQALGAANLAFSSLCCASYFLERRVSDEQQDSRLSVAIKVAKYALPILIAFPGFALFCGTHPVVSSLFVLAAAFITYKVRQYLHNSQIFKQRFSSSAHQLHFLQPKDFLYKELQDSLAGTYLKVAGLVFKHMENGAILSPLYQGLGAVFIATSVAEIALYFLEDRRREIPLSDKYFYPLLVGGLACNLINGTNPLAIGATLLYSAYLVHNSHQLRSQETVPLVLYLRRSG